MTLTRTLLLVALFGLAACKHTPPEVAADPAEIAAPFDAAELRAGLPVGTTVLYRVSTPDGAPALDSWVVVYADKDGLVVHVTRLDEDNNAVGPVAAVGKSWELVEAESRPPPGGEVLELGQQPMALGTLQVTAYTMPNPADEAAVEIYTYSEKHPGPPVKIESKQNGEVVLTREAIEWTVGP